MTAIHAHLTEIDRVWNEQVQYLNQQRHQRIQQALAALVQSQERATLDLRQNLYTLSQENKNLREQLNRNGEDAASAPRRGKSERVELDELWLVVHQIGLRLAHAWNLRANTRDEIKGQFRAKGLQYQIVEMMCNAPGFWEELEEQLLPRRSGRLHAPPNKGLQVSE